MKDYNTILFFGLIFGILAGCTGTSTSSTSSNSVDPIVGSWNYTSPFMDQLVYFRFTESGQTFLTSKYYKDQISGNWIKNPDGTYNLYFWNETSTSNYDVWVYDKNTDTLHIPMNPEIGLARGLAYYSTIPTTTRTSPIVTRTQVIITATPTLSNYQYCRNTYPGSSYDPSTNKCAYLTTVSTRTPTQIINKEIANAEFCFYGRGNEIGVSRGNTPSFESPLVLDASYSTSYALQMPINPGKYKILLTTSTPQSVVKLEVFYQATTGNDKFGNTLYSRSQKLDIGESNRYADLNTEISIPVGSIDRKINIFVPFQNWGNDNCGTLIVTAI
jgi:hypothetical protein